MNEYRALIVVKVSGTVETFDVFTKSFEYSRNF